MQNFKLFFDNLVLSAKLKLKNKKILYPSIWVLIILLWIRWYYLSDFLSKRLEVPQVVWANFSIEYRKIPFDTKTLEVSFSTDLKSDSINNKTITLSPFIEWNTTLKDGNTIVYTLKSNLEIGQEYSFTVNENIESKHWVKMWKPYNIIFETISGAKVTKIFPEKTLDNISQNLLVLFNIPLIPLTSLDNKDNLPCPVEITPKIAGKCRWTGWNVVEFVPEKYWEWATEYEVSVKSSDKFLYPLKETKEISFRTPNLTFKTDENFSPKNWISLVANFPVNPTDIEKSIDLKNWNNKINVKLEPVEWSETRFAIKPINWNFNYNKSYTLAIPAWISPKYWNIPTKYLISNTSTSSAYLSSIEVYQNALSSTGAIEDTRLFSDTTKIPTKNVFFKLNFEEGVSLNENLFSFTWKGKQTPFSLKYGTESISENGKTVDKESKKIVILTLKNELDYDSSYELKIFKKANENLDKDEIHSFKTVKAFKIADFKYIDNTLACVYLTNYLFSQSENSSYYDYTYWDKKDANQTQIKLTPNAPVRSIARDIKNYETNKYICPQKSGQISYLLNFRLAPFTSYGVSILSGLKDDFGNTLDKAYSYNIKSGDIKESDKYLYSSFSKQVNIIPSDLPTVIDIQSINLNKASLEVCEMNVIWYNDYLTRTSDTNFKPKCIQNYNWEISLKNKNWTLSHNRFDIEKDVIWAKIISPIYLITGKIWTSTGEWKKFENIIIKSNLSLTLENAWNKNLLFASSLDGKDIPSNLTFEGFDINSSNNLISVWKIKAKWIKDKKVYEIPWFYNIIVAKNDKYYWIVNTSNDATSNYDFKYISGLDSSTSDFLYLYTERPIYRPGDTVFFKWILRNFNFDWYHKSDTKKGKLKILDAEYNFFKEIEVSVDKNSNFSGKFELPRDMKFGKFNFEFYPNWSQISVYNDWNFFVEEYKKPVFKINLNSDKKDAIIWDNVNLNFDGEYYFGWKLNWAHFYKWVLSQNYFFDAKDYSDYQFSTWYDWFNCVYWGYCDYGDETLFSEEWNMKAWEAQNWNYAFPTNTTDSNNKNLWEKIYSFSVTLEDPDTKKQVSKTTEVILHNTDAYVWVKAPYYSAQKDWIKFDGIVLNYSAQPLSWKKVKIELIKKEWKNVKKQWVDGIFYNDYAAEEKIEDTKEYSSSSNWELSDTLMPKTSGEYTIKATYTGSNWKTFVSSTSVYVGWEEVFYWWDWNNSVTDLIADKSILKVGDTANFTLKSPVSSGKLFVTVEKDNWILDYFTQDIKSTGERISIPIKDTYYPNFYVKVFLIWKSWSNPLPIYKRALSVVKVVTDYKKLKVSIAPAKNHYKPGEKVTLNIKTTDIDGKPIPYANGSVSIVDESLLALKWNPKKNPFAFFYEMKRYLGVNTYLSLLNLVEKLEIKDISDGEKWWAGEWVKWWDSKKKRWVFKDTAFWQADYTTDANWKASITTDALPDNLTTWVIESVASTPLDNKIWVWEATIVTTQKVIINENVPRFLGSNDTIILSPVVFNKTGKNSIFTVSLTWENIDIENPTQEIKINNWEQKTVEFRVKVKDIWVYSTANPTSKITIKAVSKDTQDSDEIEKFLPIKESSTKETVATVWKTDKVSYTEKIDLTNTILSSAKLTINFSQTILSNITSGIDFLANFPYGCIEQKQSAILPNVYIKKLYTSAWLPFDLTKKMVKVWVDGDTWYKNISEDEIIKNFIAESITFQKNSLWFWYWTNEPSNAPADFHLTSMVVDGMSEIKSIGYTINDKSIKGAISYLKTRFYANKIEWCSNPDYYNNFCKYSETSRLDAISAILSYDPNDYEAYKMWKLLDTKKEELSTKISKVDVIAKLTKNKNISEWDKKTLKTQAVELVNNIIWEFIVYNPRWAFLGKDSYSSRILNTTNFIGAVSNLWLDNFKDISQIIDNMNRWIISEKKDWSFGSTQENNYAIKNLTKYIVSSGELKNIKSNIKLLLNSEVIDEKNIDDKNKLEIFTKIIEWNKLKPQNDFVINKQWSGNVYYDLSLSYFLPINKVIPRDEGFYLEQTYFDYNQYRKIENLKNLEWANYMSWTIDYKDLKYPKNIVEYLNEIRDFKVGQLVLAYNKIVTSEPRDQVAFEWFIPAWCELVNTNLSTENKSLKFTNFFDREEFRDDRYFGFASSMEAGLFEFNYVIRITHKWDFNLKPSQISEFYKSEVFWRNKGKLIGVRK